MNADDSAKMRDLLASNRTFLAWIRTAISFAGLGFVVARFGISTGLIRASGYLGILMALIGLLFTGVGYFQHILVLRQETGPPGSPQPPRWPAVAAAACCALACALITGFLVANTV